MKVIVAGMFALLSLQASAEMTQFKVGSDKIIAEYRKEQLAQKQQLTQALGDDTWAYATMIMPNLLRAKKPSTVQELLMLMTNQVGAAQGTAGGGMGMVPGQNPGMTTGGGMNTGINPSAGPAGSIK